MPCIVFYLRSSSLYICICMCICMWDRASVVFALWFSVSLFRIFMCFWTVRCNMHSLLIWYLRSGSLYHCICIMNMYVKGEIDQALFVCAQFLYLQSQPTVFHCLASVMCVILNDSFPLLDPISLIRWRELPLKPFRKSCNGILNTLSECYRLYKRIYAMRL